MFPDDWDLPDEGQWKVEHDSETSCALFVPGDDQPYGPFVCGVDIRGHEADWSQSYMAGRRPATTPPMGMRSGTRNSLIVAAAAPDVDAFGYLCVSLGEPAHLDAVAARRRWIAALSRLLSPAACAWTIAVSVGRGSEPRRNRGWMRDLSTRRRLGGTDLAVVQAHRSPVTWRHAYHRAHAAPPSHPPRARLLDRRPAAQFDDRWLAVADLADEPDARAGYEPREALRESR